MKKLLKKILPVCLYDFLRGTKRQLKFLRAKLNVLLKRPLKKKRNTLGFRFHAAEHCNLNCFGCDNFSPLAEPEFVSVEELKRDMTRLAEIFGNNCDYIYISGGEPLMHPEIRSIMKITRESFPESDIYIFSNGILLSQQENEFWRSCHDNNIGIFVSAYPIEIDIKTIQEQAERFSVKFQWAWGENEHEREIFSIRPVNLKGDSDMKLNFALCGRANNCITLSHGRLFTCTFAPHVRHFSKYFNQDVRITESDYVNIYDDISADEILRKMAEPIPACRYCDLVNPERQVKWGLSKREISEWA